MKVTFYIDYETHWGESVHIIGSCKELGQGEECNAPQMSLVRGNTWSLTLNLPSNGQNFTYSYAVKLDDGAVIRREWGKPRNFVYGKGVSNYELHDSWQEMPENKPFYSSAFTEGIFSRKKDAEELKPEQDSILLKVLAPLVKSDEELCVSGDADLLGNWNVEKALTLNDYSFPRWEILLKGIKTPFDYKFFIRKKKEAETSRVPLRWESSDNRTLSVHVSHGEAVVVSGLVFNDFDSRWKGAGTAIPVFSLRSEKDFGVGDFYDLFGMVDWAKSTGQKILQLLPINDTTLQGNWIDSYPYKANSTFALHPMYLRPDAIGKLSDVKRQAYYDKIAQELNSLKEVDYEKVNAAKMSLLRELFDELGEKTTKSPSYRAFLKENLYWLKPYAAFCSLRNRYKTAEFKKWEKYTAYDAGLVDSYCAENENENDIKFIYFIQYHLDKQLKKARNYAHSQGVVLKGDIPIGISRDSVDAWMYPSLFYMDCQAGAPPDDFSVMGQNWGFPTYNWEEMSKDGFQWWKNRFRKMSEYFDAYRIDHILGFFRIWQIPMNAVHGLLGTFNPAMPFTADELRLNYDFWINKDVQTQPYIMDYFLHDFFGEFVDEARQLYLEHIDRGRYRLKEFVNTQRKIENYFSLQVQNEKSLKIKNALLGLVDQVLFIEDVEQRGKFHPRISAQYTYVYKSLTDYEKWCFDRLYNDFFYHRHNDFWYGKAMWKLPPLINATDMLVCGEDLGMIPDCVSAVMQSQKILSLEIQRMPKDPKQEFGNPYQYPYLSVCTTSTHDMAGIRAWWEEDRETTQHFYNNMLHQSGGAPFYAEPWICDKIVSMHLDSPAMLTILPLQDWLSVNGELRRENPNEEQINVPANPQHYWRYRMHFTIESLLSQKAFNQSLKMRIEASGR